MNYRIRYPGSRPRSRPANKPDTHHNWMKSGTRLAGLHVAGQCIVCMLIFGFGLSVIGALSLVMSASTPSSSRQGITPPAIVGCVFLGTGSSILFLGLVFFCCAAKRAKKRLLREKTACPTIQETSEGPQLDDLNAEQRQAEMGVEPGVQTDPSVYYISNSQEVANPPQYSMENSGYVADKTDEKDQGFTGFTYSGVEGQPASAPSQDALDDNGMQQRSLPARLPPIKSETNKTIYSTPASFGRQE